MGRNGPFTVVGDQAVPNSAKLLGGPVHHRPVRINRVASINDSMWGTKCPAERVFAVWTMVGHVCPGKQRFGRKQHLSVRRQAADKFVAEAVGLAAASGFGRDRAQMSMAGSSSFGEAKFAQFAL